MELDSNYFDPDMFMSNTDPLAEWAKSLQSDPNLLKLMATDPQAAAKRMADAGIPPPPGDLSSYAEGGVGDERSRGMARPSQVVGGATPPPAAAEPTPRFDPTPQAGSFGDKIVRLLGSTWGPKAAAPQTMAEGTPLPIPDPRKTTSPFDPIPGPAGPEILEPEANPSAGQPMVPRPRPPEAGPTDVSSQNRLGEALGGFGKSLQGVKPVAPPAPNYVSTPSVRSPGAISAPNLQNLLGLIGQGSPSPLGLTLGRLLATGKA